MWSTTGWALWTWLKITIAQGLLVLGVWLFGTSGWLAITLIGSVLVQWWVIGHLAREWASVASWHWWWN